MANAAPNAGTQVEQCTIIATLKDLDGMKNEVYPKTYVNNLNKIHGYNQDEIVAKLASHESDDVRKELRQHLLTQLTQSDTFSSDYSRRTPIDRRAGSKALICQDIYHLGFCIVNKTATKGLDSVFKNEQIEPAEEEKVTDTSDAVLIMVDMRKKMEELRKDHEEFKTKMLKENAELRNEIKSMEIKCAQNHQNRSDEVEVSGTPPNAQTGEQESNTSSSQITNELVEPSQLAEHNSEIPEGSENSEPHAPAIRPITAASEPQEPAIRPVTAAPKLTDIFISGVNPNNSPADISAFINSKTGSCIEPRNVQEINISRRDKKAFKVTIPQNKFEEATSIWPTPIRAERYVKPRQKNMHPTQRNAPRTNNGHNRNHRQNSNNNNSNGRNNGHNNNNNRNSRTQNRRQTNNRYNGGNQHNGGNQNNGSSRHQPFQERGQNNHRSYSNGQGFHPSEHTGFTQIPNPLWSLFRASGLLNQPFINI